MKVQDNIRCIFQQAEIAQQPNGKWHVGLPEMSRAEYAIIKTIFGELEGKWNRNLGTHVFKTDPSQDIATIAETGIAPDINPHDFFATPLPEIDNMIELSGISRCLTNKAVLEPNGGDGRIIKAILTQCPNIAQIDYCEIEPRRLELLEQITRQHPQVKCVGKDFLKASLEPIYDVIIMNPPFNGREYQDHVLKAISLLKENGTLVTLLPEMSLGDRRFTNQLFGVGQPEIFQGTHKFEGTKIKYVVVAVHSHKTSCEPPDGYESWHEFNLLLSLDNDQSFVRSIEAKRLCREIGDFIKEAVDRLITQEHIPLVLDNHLLDLAIAHYTKHRQELGLA